jgi:hypothetical protein
VELLTVARVAWNVTTAVADDSTIPDPDMVTVVVKVMVAVIVNEAVSTCTGTLKVVVACTSTVELCWKITVPEPSKV